MDKPNRKSLNLPLAMIGLSNSQQKLRKENKAVTRRSNASFSKQAAKKNPKKSFLITEEILKDIISEGYTEYDILKEFKKRISELETD
ncbi:hypothetical protein [Lentibacillus sediminis]|uniref:hypothetical protein n=1 Tax=Lentibacillus sediminis TaxID=1940529 RepID=UPI000C1BAC01|nr:hypothetical protein [Lentibacillus sediminis]